METVMKKKTKIGVIYEMFGILKRDIKLFYDLLIRKA